MFKYGALRRMLYQRRRLSRDMASPKFTKIIAGRKMLKTSCET